MKFCLFFCFCDRASSASTTQTMKIFEFSLFSVLVFNNLRKNKPDKLFWKPPQLFLGRKSWQKEPSRPAVAAVFQGPLRPKKQAWFFFLELSRVKKKEPKKKPPEKKRLTKQGRKSRQRRMRWLLIYWTKVLIAGAETSRACQLLQIEIPGAETLGTSCLVKFPGH